MSRGFDPPETWRQRGLAHMRIFRWFRVRSAGPSTLRRAVRIGFVMPAVVAIAIEFVGDRDFAIFAAFGALAGLLFVDFSGPMHVRLSAQTGLVLSGAVLVCLGTLASQVIWVAAAATLAIVSTLLFVGVVSSVLASATTALLVSFILPVTMPGSVSSIPDRLGGWLLGGATSLIAIAVRWAGTCPRAIAAVGRSRMRIACSAAARRGRMRSQRF